MYFITPELPNSGRDQRLRVKWKKVFPNHKGAVGVMSDVLAHNESNGVALLIDQFYCSMVTVVSSYLRISFD